MQGRVAQHFKYYLLSPMNMDFQYQKDAIIMQKELNSLDRFVLHFCTLLNRLEIRYVIISGYVAILFGRSRSSEDIDMFIEPLSWEKFSSLWKESSMKFECLATNDAKGAYEEYLKKDTAIRFSYKGEYIPNMEVKFPKARLDMWSLDNRKRVRLNEDLLFISSIELQIAFKLFLGSEKDIEDAKHLYNLFSNYLDRDLLGAFLLRLEVVNQFKRYLK
jgi:hypothetical protein